MDALLSVKATEKQWAELLGILTYAAETQVRLDNAAGRSIEFWRMAITNVVGE